MLLLALLMSPIFRVLVFIAYQPYERRIHIGIIYSYSNSNNIVTYFHWKILALAGIRTRDLPGTKPICYKFSYPGLDPQELFASLGTKSKHPQLLVECSSNMNKKYKIYWYIFEQICIKVQILKKKKKIWVVVRNLSKVGSKWFNGF